MNHFSIVPSWTPLTPSSTSASAGPSFATSTSYPPPSSASISIIRSDSESKTRSYRRRPKEVYEILGHFFHHVTDYPNRQQRDELAKRIQCIPGCEDYKASNVNQYFATKRQTERRASVEGRDPQRRAHPEPVPFVAPPSAMTSAHVLWPSLTKEPKTLPLLEVLCKENPTPTIEIANIWAESLGNGATPEHILRYARHRELQSRRGGEHSTSPPPPAMPPLPQLPPFSVRRNPPAHLPTPDISPEPPSNPASPVVENGGIIAQSMTKASVKEEEEDELKSESDEDMEVEAEEPILTAHDTIDSRLHGQLAVNLHKALSQSRVETENGSSSAPRSFAQFSQWMGKQNQASASLLDGVSRGTYAHLGLKPIASSAPPANT
ncbi:hypothetical protein BD309DRAFT_968626 [Dichomitus squalens]|nr:hypothetical protein BD309DRAFT_968626 [Dichomitus squalens]